MPSKNWMVLEGHLGGDPELKYTSQGKSVCSFSVAESYGKADNRKTQWHRVVVWGDLGEAVVDEFVKGDAIHIEGTYRSRSWQTPDGEKRTTWEITAYQVSKPIYKRRVAGEQNEGEIDDDIPPF